MNRKNVQILVKHLHTLSDHKVTMETWFRKGDREVSPRLVHSLDLEDCKTAACLAGWAVLLFASDEEKDELDGTGVTIVAERYLEFGSTDPYMDETVYDRRGLEQVTRKDVIKYLEARLAYE